MQVEDWYFDMTDSNLCLNKQTGLSIFGTERPDFIDDETENFLMDYPMNFKISKSMINNNFNWGITINNHWKGKIDISQCQFKDNKYYAIDLFMKQGIPKPAEDTKIKIAKVDTDRLDSKASAVRISTAENKIDKSENIACKLFAQEVQNTLGNWRLEHSKLLKNGIKMDNVYLSIVHTPILVPGQKPITFANKKDESMLVYVQNKQVRQGCCVIQ